MIGRFIKRAAVRAAGLAITQYAAKAALQSEAGRKLLATTASKAANLAGNIAKSSLQLGLMLISGQHCQAAMLFSHQSLALSLRFVRLRLQFWPLRHSFSLI